jgi:acyl-CoA synthetase (AMP-forming)/AMP-acid ligase II
MSIYRSPYPDPRIPALTLDAYVLEHAAKHGARTALIDGATGERATYAQVARAVEQGASGLVAEGIRPGDVVALVAANAPVWAVAFFAILAAGGVVLPLNPTLTAEEIARWIGLANARLVVASDAARDESISASRIACRQDVVTLDPLLRQGPFNEIVGNGPLPRVARDPARALAVIAGSSGTSGMPKGVMLSHRNLVANIEQHQGLQVLGPGDASCAVLPFCHSYGMTIVLNAALRNGATVVTLPGRFDAERYLGVVERYRVTRLHLAPPMVYALSSYPALDARNLSSVRIALSGAAPLDAVAARALSERAGFPVVQGYGLTEASPGTHFVPDDAAARLPAGSVGVLVPGTEARLVSPETGADVTGEGELLVRGPQVMVGYLDAPEDSAKALLDGWLRTGDILRLDGSGAFFVIDRVKELIKYRAHSIAPAELEALLRTHPQVADAAVIGLPQKPDGEIPVGYVVARGELDPQALLAWVADRVAPFKKLRDVRLVTEIPRTPAGKILRRVLRDRG